MTRRRVFWLRLLWGWDSWVSLCARWLFNDKLIWIIFRWRTCVFGAQWLPCDEAGLCVSRDSRIGDESHAALCCWGGAPCGQNHSFRSFSAKGEKTYRQKCHFVDASTCSPTQFLISLLLSHFTRLFLFTCCLCFGLQTCLRELFKCRIENLFVCKVWKAERRKVLLDMQEAESSDMLSALAQSRPSEVCARTGNMCHCVGVPSLINEVTS